jgi:hypothetical protein
MFIIAGPAVVHSKPEVHFSAHFAHLWYETNVQKDEDPYNPKLKRCVWDAFVGGLEDNSASRQLAPDLILPKKMTERKAYLRNMHTCDIYIATTEYRCKTG